MIFLIEEPVKEIFSILPSIIAVFSALAGFGFSWFLNHKSYKNDFYKKIIDKRLDAYEKAEKILNELRLVIIIDNKHLNVVFKDKQTYLEFSLLLKEAAISSHWLNYDIVNIFNQINEVTSTNKFDNAINPGDFQSAGFDCYKELTDYTIKLEELLFEIIIQLHKVKKFVKVKNKTFKEDIEKWKEKYR